MGWRTYQVTVAQTAIPLMGYSKDRIGFAVMAPAANNFYVSPDAGVTATSGFRVPANTIFPYEFGEWRDPHGPLYAITDAGNNIACIAEYLIKPRSAEEVAARLADR